jgi:hypothetical protein
MNERDVVIRANGLARVVGIAGAAVSVVAVVVGVAAFVWLNRQTPTYPPQTGLGALIGASILVTGLLLGLVAACLGYVLRLVAAVGLGPGDAPSR